MKIQLDGLRKTFDGEALFFIGHCLFAPGKIYGLIGHNGVGKTTLLRMIGGFDSDYQGQMRYDGKPFTEELLKRMSYIYQQPYMLNRTVQENLAYPLRLRKHPEDHIKDEVAIWMDRLDIAHLRDRKATVLSAGEMQKVALARGLIYKPDLVLLDEPTANIDPDTVEILEKILRDYQVDAKATIIWVTHNLRQAVRNCDQIAALQNGSLKWIDKDVLKKGVESAMLMDKLMEMETNS